MFPRTARSRRRRPCSLVVGSSHSLQLHPPHVFPCVGGRAEHHCAQPSAPTPRTRTHIIIVANDWLLASRHICHLHPRVVPLRGAHASALQPRCSHSRNNHSRAHASCGGGGDGRGGEGTTRTKRRVKSEREVWHRLTHGERGEGSGGRAAFCAWDGARRRTLMPSVAVVSLSLHSGAPSAAPALCTLHTCLFLGPQAPARASGASSSRALPSLLPPAASPPQLMIARPLASHPL